MGFGIMLKGEFPLSIVTFFGLLAVPVSVLGGLVIVFALKGKAISKLVIAFFVCLGFQMLQVLLMICIAILMAVGGPGLLMIPAFVVLFIQLGAYIAAIVFMKSVMVAAKEEKSVEPTLPTYALTGKMDEKF
jgi:hypothetical protein